VRVVVLAAMAALFAGSAWADEPTDPKGLVTAIYAPYLAHTRPSDPAVYYSDGLKALFAKHRLEDQTTGVGMSPKAKPAATDFDPFVSDSRYLLMDLDIADAVVSGDHAMVTVSYKNFDHPTVLTISLLHAAEGWKVDDVASLGGDQHWLLSWLLNYDPMGVH
jgi:hypothetical protein